MKTFRGHTSAIWRERLIAAEWPEPQASAMANFLVGLTDMPPTWAELLDPATATTTLSLDQAADLLDRLDREVP